MKVLMKIFYAGFGVLKKRIIIGSLKNVYREHVQEVIQWNDNEKCGLIR